MISHSHRLLNYYWSGFSLKESNQKPNKFFLSGSMLIVFCTLLIFFLRGGIFEYFSLWSYRYLLSVIIFKVIIMYLYLFFHVPVQIQRKSKYFTTSTSVCYIDIPLHITHNFTPWAIVKISLTIFGSVF